MRLKRRASTLSVRDGHVSSGLPYDQRDPDFAINRAGWGRNLAIQQYDDLTHRIARKQIHSYMGTPAALARFSDIQDLETHRFLLRVLRSPETLGQHIRKCVTPLPLAVLR